MRLSASSRSWQLARILPPTPHLASTIHPLWRIAARPICAKMAEPEYTVFVRVPAPRGDFVDPPQVSTYQHVHDAADAR